MFSVLNLFVFHYLVRDTHENSPVKIFEKTDEE